MIEYWKGSYPREGVVEYYCVDVINDSYNWYSRRSHCWMPAYPTWSRKVWESVGCVPLCRVGRLEILVTCGTRSSNET